ncbi:hypothetical protein IAT38_002257 [Cryptococcus sp. DSM 104549]
MSSAKVSPFSSPKLLIARLTRLTSSLPGLDASLMLAQYSSPLVIALLLRLAALRAKYPRVRFSSSAAGGKVTVDGGFGLVKLAEGWARAGGSIGDARVIMRAFGLLPILSWLLSLHPKPLVSLRSFASSIASGKVFHSEKTLPTLQAVSLLLYYPLEHLSWLASKGVVPLEPATVGKATLWSVRFWALYVVLEICRLRNVYYSLNNRTRALKAAAKPEVTASEAEGYELQEGSDAKGVDEKAGSAEDKVATKQALVNDWAVWKNAVLVNSGYAPLTIHWSTPGGLWTNPLITGVLGSVAAVGQIQKQWWAGA